MDSILIALVVLVSPILLWAVVKGFLRSGMLSADENIRRLGRYDWYTRDPRERHFIRRDAAEVLSSSENPRARRFAVKCLRRKANLAVMDTCSKEILAGLTDPDPLTAQGCAELIQAYLGDGISISLSGDISGVAMGSSDNAKRYLEMIREASRSGINDSTVATILSETEQHLQSYIDRYPTGSM
jgi:hypothetical protein